MAAKWSTHERFKDGVVLVCFVMEAFIMTRKLGLYLVAAAVGLLTFATADDAQAFGRRNGGSCGSNGGYSSNGGSWGGNGGSFGGRFRRHRNGSNGSHGSNGGYNNGCGSNGGYSNGCGSNGGYNNGCGSHGGYSNGYHHDGDVHYGDDVRVEHEANYGDRSERTYDDRRDIRGMRAPAVAGAIETSQDRDSAEQRDESRDAASQERSNENQATEGTSNQSESNPELSPPEPASPDTRDDNPNPANQPEGASNESGT
jgi:hypothetical protein